MIKIYIHLVWDQGVEGSNPFTPTIYKALIISDIRPYNRDFFHLRYEYLCLFKRVF